MYGLREEHKTVCPPAKVLTETEKFSKIIIPCEEPFLHSRKGSGWAGSAEDHCFFLLVISSPKKPASWQ